MIHEFQKPIPVVVQNEKGEFKDDGYAIYVSDSSTFENDVWTIALCNSGRVQHYTTDKIRIYNNATFGIHEKS